MPELRKDYILDRWVIIATERGKRPHEFSAKKNDDKPTIDYFAPGNEHLTPPEIGRWPKDAKGNDWKIRWFPNKFSAVKAEGHFTIRTDNDFFTFADAYGYHEVIVENPDTDGSIEDEDVQLIEELLKVYAQRIRELSKKDGIKYVIVFKNKGSDAGTSIYHTHSQIIAFNKVPETILEKERAVSKYGYDPYEKIMQIEKNSNRKIKENNSMICFSPYASRFPMEAVIFPKRFVLSITEFTDAELKDFAALLKHLLLRLKTINAQYNFYLHYGIEKMRFHLIIAPRLSKWAGFEMATDTVINTVAPEEAAKFYRGED
jgi:UDPglucose--hexose-1-phosphate uridylyltransferase